MTLSNIYEDGVMLTSKYAPISGSDPVLKHDISEPADGALELVETLPLHSFTWNDDAPRHQGEHWPVGFIAPELYEIDKNLAKPPTEGENGSYWSVDTFYLVGLLTKSVQELSEKIKQQERRIEQLERMVKP